MTLAEGVKLEKKLFYSTFATVSSLIHVGNHMVQPWKFWNLVVDFITISLWSELIASL